MVIDEALQLGSSTTTTTTTNNDATTSPARILASTTPEAVDDSPMEEDILWAAQQDIVVLKCRECLLRQQGLCYTRPSNSFDMKGQPEAAHFFCMQEQDKFKYLSRN